MPIAERERVRTKRGCADFCCCCFSKNVEENMSPDDRRETPQKHRRVIPYNGDLPEEPRVGKAICVGGELLPNCSRFAINLICGKTSSADIAFHFNPRLEQRYVVRNCRLNGYWGAEETTSPVKFDFERGKAFEVDMLIAANQFLVSVNGRHFCAFGYRVPLVQVTGIEIEGRVLVKNVEYREMELYPEGKVLHKVEMCSRRRKKKMKLDCSLEVPYTTLLPRGFKVGWQLEIYGRVKILPHSFYINLQEGWQVWPHPAVPLHLNVRFRSPKGEPTLIRNSWLGGTWGQEERTTTFQFTPGSPFTVVIRLYETCFSVWVNGRLSGEFSFRCPAENIDTVHVHGDVVLKEVFMSQKIHDLYLDQNKT